MRKRPSSRLLILDDLNRLLLFQFKNDREARLFWSTPGGAVDPGESHEEAAGRELFEETGLTLPVGREIAQRTATFALFDGEMVEADERYFFCRAPSNALETSNWTDLEREVMASHKWWTRNELSVADEEIWFRPEELIAMLENVGAWG